MTPKQRIKHITRWLDQYARSAKTTGFVVGISGGIDSAVVSTLCAQTGRPTIAVSMPIRQSRATHNLSMAHGAWLADNYDNVLHAQRDLTPVFRQFERLFPEGSALAFANTRSRLRMMCLYQIAQDHGKIVVGTGNRVEDFGVGFFTKYGDGGVDISPIGDCLKTDVWAMGRELGVLEAIITAAPTDGLWEDGRTDEDQLGMTYPDLERAMEHDLLESQCVYETLPLQLSKTERAQLKKYREIRQRNMHKMLPIPVCRFD